MAMERMRRFYPKVEHAQKIIADVDVHATDDAIDWKSLRQALYVIQTRLESTLRLVPSLAVKAAL
jgi:hypothetical protein